MKITVSKLMDLESYSQSMVLVAGQKGTDNVVTFITVSETPDFYQWVSGGEFVLTTLYAFEEHKEEMILNYTELAKRGIAAVAVKVNRFVGEIPQELMHIADTYKVPLFAVRRQAKFREIIQTVTAELNNYQTNILIEVESHYKELAKAALTGEDFAEYLQGLGRRKVGSYIFCFKADLLFLGSYPKQTPRKTIYSVKEKLEKYLAIQTEVLEPAQDDGLYIYPCISRKQALGYLVIVSENSLDEKHKLMAAQLTTFLTIKLADQLEMEQKMLTALLDELLYKRNLNEQELQGRLALHGLTYQQRYRVILVKKRSDDNDLSIPANAIVHLGNKIRELLGDVIVINKVNEAVIIVSQHSHDSQWLRKLRQNVSDTLPLLIGIGPSVFHASDIHTSYQIAKSTIKSGAVFGDGGILYHANYLARNLVQRTIGTVEQEYLVSQVISPLVDHDRRHNTCILSTIAAMIFANEIEEAAESLFVHPNTIRYRLNKIKNLTGHDFFTAGGRYVITTAYLVYCYNK